MMKICVTGGCGFIGSELVKKLKRLGYEVVIVDSTNLKYTDNYIDWKFILENNYYSFLDNVDFIYLLGANSDTRSKKEEIRLSNLVSPLKMIVECNSRNIPMVFASSASIYGSKRRPNGAIRPQTPYADAKAKIDQYIANDFHDFNDKGKIVSLRYHNVYGASETKKGTMASIVSKWLDNYINGVHTFSLFYGSDKIKRDFIHVEDVNNINMMFLHYYVQNNKLPDVTTYDVGCGKPISFQQVANAINEVTGGIKIKYVDNPYDKKNYQYYTKANIQNISDIYKSLYDKPYEPMDILTGVQNTLILKTIQNVEQNSELNSRSGNSNTPVKRVRIPKR